ncbi:MAG: redoxin family protein [Bacteroidota bacterium]
MGEFEMRIFPFNMETLQNGAIKLNSRIDEEGYFEIETDLIESELNSTWATIGNEISYMTISAGDDLYIEVDANAFDETIRFTGKGAERNNHRAQRFLRYEDREMGVNPDELLNLNFRTFVKRHEILIREKNELLDSICADVKNESYYTREKQLIANHFLQQIIKHQQMNGFSDYGKAKQLVKKIGVNDQIGLFQFNDAKNSIIAYPRFLAGASPSDLEVYTTAKEVLTGNALRYFYKKGVEPMLSGEDGKQILADLHKSEVDNSVKEQLNAAYEQITQLRDRYPDQEGNYTVFAKNLKKDTFKISGHIKGGNPPKKVVVYDQGLTARTQIETKVDSLGNFLLKIPLYFSHDLNVIIGRTYATLLAHPGDHLHLEIKGGNINFFGDGAVDNRALQEYLTANSSQHLFSRSDLLSLDPSTVKKEVIAKYKSDQDFNKNYFAEKNLPIVKKYAENKILLENFGPLVQYDPYRKYRNKKEQIELIPLPADFYDFESKYLKFQPEVVLNSESISLCTGRASKLYAESVDLSPEEQLAYVLDLAKAQFNPMEYEVYFTMTMNRHLSEKDFEIIDPYIIKYQKEITSPWIVDEFISEYKRQKEIFAGLVIEEGTDLNNAPETSADSLLANILKKHQGKAIYIDIWATWCSPCVGEFAYAKEFHEALDKEKVATVYLAGHSKENVWKAMIAEHDLKGDHYLLTEEQYEEISSKFESRGFPHYAIIDPNGIIKYKNAPRPSLGQQKLNDGLVEILNKM